jgi:hypothetical protein
VKSEKPYYNISRTNYTQLIINDHSNIKEFVSGYPDYFLSYDPPYIYLHDK